MDKEKNISKERKQYLKKKKTEKFINDDKILIVQKIRNEGEN